MSLYDQQHEAVTLLLESRGLVASAIVLGCSRRSLASSAAIRRLKVHRTVF